jgi:hypothetical protein
MLSKKSAFVPSLSQQQRNVRYHVRSTLSSLQQPRTTIRLPTMTTTTTMMNSASVVVYEPMLPDSTIVGGMIAVIILSIVAAIVWNTQVVPISRTKLAISKSRGSVRAYLEDLRMDENVDNKNMEFNNDDKSMEIESDDNLDHDSETMETNIPSTSNRRQNRSLERWLLTDWLQNLDRQSTSSNGSSSGRRRKDPAIPGFLPKAKWNSGDNPVLVTVLIMMVGIVIASVTERLATI